MPTTTWIEVVDNAVKIGLGALIGGVFAWLVARYNAKMAVDKVRAERRLNLLLEALQAHEAFFRGFYEYFTALHGIEGALQSKAEPRLPEPLFAKFISDRRAEAVRIRMRVFMETIHDVYGAHAKLLLLREKNCLEQADNLREAILKADASFRIEDQAPGNLDLAPLRAQMRFVVSAREQFYSAMSNAFDGRGPK